MVPAPCSHCPHGGHPEASGSRACECPTQGPCMHSLSQAARPCLAPPTQARTPWLPGPPAPGLFLCLLNDPTSPCRGRGGQAWPGHPEGTAHPRGRPAPGGAFRLSQTCPSPLLPGPHRRDEPPATQGVVRPVGSPGESCRAGTPLGGGEPPPPRGDPDSPASGSGKVGNEKSG